jgi:hypothetical protein
MDTNRVWAKAEELVPASPSLSILGVLQRSALSWIGVIGGAVTLFGNIDAWLSLADWASWLVAHWNEWLRSFWRAALALLGIEPDAPLRLDLTWSVFLIATALGSRIEAIRAGEAITPLNLAAFLRSTASFGCALAGYAAVVLVTPYLISHGIVTLETRLYIAGISLWAILFVAVMHWPTTAAFGTATALEAIFLLMLAGIHAEVEAADGIPIGLELIILGVSGFTAFWLAVPNRFHVRIWFMLIGVLLLLALNELSTLAISIKAPPA